MANFDHSAVDKHSLRKWMKTAALDVGDVWTGIALSDALGITAKPYHTVKTPELISYLETLFAKEPISTILVGLPRTMKGTDSEQTLKVRSFFAELSAQFPTLNWKLWDERLSSKRAASVKTTTSKEDKIKSHAIAAAFILHSYLSGLS